MTNKGRKIIKFVDCKSEVPIVEFILGNGGSLYAVVDTGSETTLFDLNLLLNGYRKDFPLHKTNNKINFVGVQNSTENPLIKTSPVIKFNTTDKSEEQISVQVKDAVMLNLQNLAQHIKDNHDTDIVVSSVLGSDFLSMLKAEINYQKKEMIIDYDLSCQ